MNKTTIESMTAQAMEQTDREWVENAPRFFINEKECVEAWYAHELFTRLKMILFVVANFDPGENPARITEYRKGLANIAKHGVPEPGKPITPDSHD